MYNFGLLGHQLSFREKICKHISNKNCDRVKDYICSAYDTFDPKNAKSHPCYEVISEGIELLRNNGWIVGTGYWKDLGMQLIIQSPDHDFYHSNFEKNC